MSGPLKGIRVVSFGVFAQVPLAAQRLGDFGADVIKVEPPETGEKMRTWSQASAYLKGESVSFLAYNRNKRSVALDLKSEAGLAIVLRLLKTADVLIENFRPGVMDRLGLGFNALHEIVPSLIYCSASGFGAKGPDGAKPAVDLLAQARGGLVWLNGRRTDPPMPVGTNISDIYSANLLAFAVVSALFYRFRTGEGQLVEVDLLSSTIDMQGEEFSLFLNCGLAPERSETGTPCPYLGAPYGIFATTDGFVAIGLASLSQVFDALGLHSLAAVYADDPNSVRAYTDRDRVRPIVEEAIRKLSTSGALAALEKVGIWCTRVNSFEEVVKDPQVMNQEMFVTMAHSTVGPVRLTGIPIRMSATPGELRLPPPVLGEHTGEVLAELGYSQQDIQALRKDGAIWYPS